MRAIRLLGAGLLVPAVAIAGYNVALQWDGDRTVIDANGAAVGVMFMLLAVFGVARVADDDGWEQRAVTAIALACGYFMLSWSMFGDSSSSPDASPHLVWFGLCVAAFMPVVAIVPATRWAWSSYRQQT